MPRIRGQQCVTSILLKASSAVNIQMLSRAAAMGL